MFHIAVLSTLLIAFASIIPLPSALGTVEMESIALNISHLIIYIVCSFSWARSLKSKITYVILMGILIPLTEVLQLPIPYRNSSLGDLITNLTGAILGAIFSFLSHTSYPQRTLESK